MFQYLGYLIFIISVALAAGGVILSIRLRNKYHGSIFSSLLYFQVFVYTFGFYGIWGQAILKVLLTQYVSSGDLIRISDIALLMGLPFLVFAWLMLIQFALVLTGRRNNSLSLTLFLLINFSILTAMGYYFSTEHIIKPSVVIKGYYISMSFLYSTIASSIILFSSRRSGLLHKHNTRILSSFIFIMMILQNITLVFYKNELWIAVIFTFVYFAGNTLIPLYLSYGTAIATDTPVTDQTISFDDFCKKFDVSPRETDIIREICNGLSNKEIADKLFITLQTVKDHTHRIYSKTNVRSRAQLITIIRELRTD